MSDNKEFENKTTSIHTLESDLASAVRDENYGKNIIKIVTDPTRSSNIPTMVGDKVVHKQVKDIFTKKNILIFSIAFIILGAGGTMLYILYKAKNVVEIEDTTVVATTTTPDVNNTNVNQPVIKNSDVLNPEIIQSADFSKLNRFEIIAEINKIKDLLITKQIKPGNNVGINTNLNIIQFFEKIRFSGDEAFLRSLNSEYAFGVYSLTDNKFETYLLIKVDNFDLTFKSILGWEKYMPVDLKDIYIGNNESTVIASSTATTTIPEKTYAKKNTIGFVDRVLKNYDIREYIKNEQNLTIIYGFINNKYLLITSGESSFIDIKDRLLKENIVR